MSLSHLVSMIGPLKAGTFIGPAIRLHCHCIERRVSRHSWLPSVSAEVLNSYGCQVWVGCACAQASAIVANVSFCVGPQRKCQWTSSNRDNCLVQLRKGTVLLLMACSSVNKMVTTPVGITHSAANHSKEAVEVNLLGREAHRAFSAARIVLHGFVAIVKVRR